jgi:hypothetical protein
MPPDPLDTMPHGADDIAHSLWRCTRAPQQRNRSREETRAFRTAIRIQAGDIDLKTRPQLNHGKHLIEYVVRLQSAVQYSLLTINDLLRISFAKK